MKKLIDHIEKELNPEYMNDVCTWKQIKEAIESHVSPKEDSVLSEKNIEMAIYYAHEKLDPDKELSYYDGFSDGYETGAKWAISQLSTEGIPTLPNNKEVENKINDLYKELKDFSPAHCDGVAMGVRIYHKWLIEKWLKSVTKRTTMKTEDIKSVVLTEEQFQQTGCQTAKELFEWIKSIAEEGIRDKTPNQLPWIKGICESILKDEQ